jgi:hypothetical protein
MIVACAALFVALGGVGYAAATIGSAQIKNNSIQGKDVKNSSLTGKDVKNSGLTGSDIKNSSLAGRDVKNNSLTGSDVLESTLGTVPSATNAGHATSADTAGSAGSAGSVSGRTPFLVTLSTGQSRTVAQNGPLSVVAQCITTGGNDIVRLIAHTTTAGAVMDGDDDHVGGADTLNPATTDDTSRLLQNSQTTSATSNVQNDIDDAFVMASNGKTLSIDGEETPLGLNYDGAKCVVAGVVNSVG